MAMAGMVAGATFAFFSSTASSIDNTFDSGTLTLEVQPNGNDVSSPAFTVSDVAPGDVNEKVIVLRNTGSIPSTSTFLADIEHSTTSNPDLADKLTLEIWDDVDNSGTVNVGDIQRGSAHISDAAWTNIDMGFGLAAGGEHKIIAIVTFDSNADNTYQNTNSTFTLNFQTNQ